MQIMGHIFYIIGLLILLSELLLLTSYSKILKASEWVDAFKKINKRNPHKKEYRSEEEYKLTVFFGTFVVFEFIWCAFGLIGASWKIFCIIFILGILIRIIRY